MGEAPIRKEREQSGDADLRDMGIDIFQRFMRRRGCTQCDHIAAPDVSAAAIHKFPGDRFARSIAPDGTQECRERVVIVHESAGIDKSMANTILQGNTPPPSGFMRYRLAAGKRRIASGPG